MSLEKWVEYGWLRREATSPSEIKDLLGIVEHSLADSKVEAVSTDLRFIAAFNASLCLATTALRTSGHRTATQTGHHVKTIESLELTIKATPKVTRIMPRLFQLAGSNIADCEIEADLSGGLTRGERPLPNFRGQLLLAIIRTGFSPSCPCPHDSADDSGIATCLL